MTHAELKAMGVRVRVHRYMVTVARWGNGWDVYLGAGAIAENFPTRAKAEQYARQLRRAMRGE